MTRQSPSVAPETLDFYQKLEAAAGGIDKTGALEEVNDQLMHIGGDLGVAAAMNPVMLEDTVKHAADRVQAYYR